MVVDGNTQLVGSDERQAVQAIQNAAKVDKFRISLSAPRLEGSNSLTVQLEVGPTSAAGVKQTSEQVWIALADDMDQSNVKRGENAGRILKHVAVVRTLAQVGTVESNSTFSKDLTVSTGNANLQNLRVVAILQESATGKVLGIGSTRFSYFSLDERVYREFSLRVLFLSRSANRKLRFGLYSLDVTNHQNPHDVYNEVVSPFFGRFAGFDRRLDGFVIDFLN
jgi:hypothetical protein